MPEESISKVVLARDYVPSTEVVIDTEMGRETLSVPTDRAAALSQNHITAAIAQRAWDAVAVRVVNRRDATPREVKDLVDAAKGIVELRALGYPESMRPVGSALLGVTATAVGQGIGEVLTKAIANGGASPQELVEKMARARQQAEAKTVTPE